MYQQNFQNTNDPFTGFTGNNVKQTNNNYYQQKLGNYNSFYGMGSNQSNFQFPGQGYMQNTPNFAG